MMDRLFFSTLLVAVAALGVITAHQALAVAPRQLALPAACATPAAAQVAAPVLPTLACPERTRQAAVATTTVLR